MCATTPFTFFLLDREVSLPAGFYYCNQLEGSPGLQATACYGSWILAYSRNSELLKPESHFFMYGVNNTDTPGIGIARALGML